VSDDETVEVRVLTGVPDAVMSGANNHGTLWGGCRTDQAGVFATRLNAGYYTVWSPTRSRTAV